MRKVRLNRIVHCKREPYDIYIGRPGKWGNPFEIGRDGIREEVTKKYEEWIRHSNLMDDLQELTRPWVVGVHHILVMEMY